MSSEKFEISEDDFTNLHSVLRKKIDEQLMNAQGEQRKKLIREIEKGKDEANMLIEEMDAEMRKAPPPYRSSLMTKVRNYRRDMDALNRDLRNASSSYSGSQGAFGGFGDEFEQAESSQRARLLQGHQSLGRASESIARSQRVAAETDQIGTDIIDELGTQRESLVRTRERLTETDQNLSRSRKILRSMGRRMMTNKLIVIIIIILEGLILAGVIYWKFFT